jgi:hypothetical protein
MLRKLTRSCAKIFRQFSLVALLSCVAFNAASASNNSTKPGFLISADTPARIVVLKKDVSVAEVTTGGLDQPKADWTNQAQSSFDTALQANLSQRSIAFVTMPALKGEDAKLLSNYIDLLKITADQAIKHEVFAGEALPTKNSDLLWTLGPGVKMLGDKINADYGLVIYSRNSYVSKGRKSAEVIASLMGEKPTTGVHAGSMTLVDLKTGDIVWMNIDVQLNGDVRNDVGANEQIAQLMEKFPTTPIPLVEKKKGKRR